MQKPPISRVVIDIIPHSAQRYETVGDWQYDADALVIRVSRLPRDPDNEKALAVAFHELCEVLICRAKGITQAQVDSFDLAYKGDGEPGDEPAAPYHAEHCFATAAERMLVAALGIAWQDYENSVEEAS